MAGKYGNLSMAATIGKYLAENVGEGEAFTLDFLVDLFGADRAGDAERRMRELSTVGWVIHTYKSDPTLPTGQRRLVAIGERVWEPGTRRPRAGGGSYQTARRQVDAIDLADVPEADLRDLLRWIEQDKREPRVIDEVWTLYSRAGDSLKPAFTTLVLAEIGRRRT